MVYRPAPSVRTRYGPLPCLSRLRTPTKRA